MQNHFSMKDRTWYLVGKMLSSEATDDELKELHNIQSSNSEVAFYIEEISKWWQSGEKIDGAESDKAFQKHLHRMNEELLLPSFFEEVLKKKKGKN